MRYRRIKPFETSRSVHGCPVGFTSTCFIHLSMRYDAKVVKFVKSTVIYKLFMINKQIYLIDYEYNQCRLRLPNFSYTFRWCKRAKGYVWSMISPRIGGGVLWCHLSVIDSTSICTCICKTLRAWRRLNVLSFIFPKKILYCLVILFNISYTFSPNQPFLSVNLHLPYISLSLQRSESPDTPVYRYW